MKALDVEFYKSNIKVMANVRARYTSGILKISHREFNLSAQMLPNKSVKNSYDMLKIQK